MRGLGAGLTNRLERGDRLRNAHDLLGLGNRLPESRKGSVATCAFVTVTITVGTRVRVSLLHYF